MILHILNGDCALEGWRQNNFDGEVLVWRENYLLGTIPETEDIENFNRIRAGELHKTFPEKSAAEIFRELQSMHQKLFSIDSSGKLVLWLDTCPFDQALKQRLLQLAAAMPEKPELYLIQQDVVWDHASFKQFADWENYPYEK